MKKDKKSKDLAVDRRKPFEKPQLKNHENLPVITAGSVTVR